MGARSCGRQIASAAKRAERRSRRAGRPQPRPRSHDRSPILGDDDRGERPRHGGVEGGVAPRRSVPAGPGDGRPRQDGHRTRRTPPAPVAHRRLLQQSISMFYYFNYRNTQMSSQNTETVAGLMRGHASAATSCVATPELAALEHLQGAGPMTTGRLGGRFSMSPGALMTLVHRLEKRDTQPRRPQERPPAQDRCGVTRAPVAPQALHRRDARHRKKFRGRERAVIPRHLEAATEPTRRHAERLARSDP